VERTALQLMLRDGYDTVSVDAIAAAAGIGRTTFFRYFGSKSGVIWAPFEQTVAWLREDLQAPAPGDDPLEVARRAVVGSTARALASSEVWLERFQLLDTHPVLRSEGYEHWERWKQALVDHLLARETAEVDPVTAAAVAGACHGVFVAELRDPSNTDADRAALLQRLDGSLERVCTALRPLVAPR